MRHTPGKHPDDLSPYLDGDLSDKRYEEIRLHLEDCAECREEAANWQDWQELFRSPEADLEVPSLQWHRIRARLEERRSGPGAWDRLTASIRPYRVAWGAVAALMMTAGLIVSGLEYRNYAEQKRQLTALSAYSESQQQWAAKADNPFRSKQASTENPFTTFETSSIRK